MIKLLKNVHIYAPAPLGKKDILITDRKICRISDKIDGYEDLPDVEVFDLTGKTAVPGYIDLHEHITGGGGEQGPSSRVPEARLSELIASGITTVVGLLGTDGITRSLPSLIAKARALTEEGITAFALTGSYGCPTVTVTGSVEKDLVMLDPIIGVKVAVSDHRSSAPSGEELIRLAAEARRGGLLSGTPGLTVIHMGSGKAGLDPVFYILDHSDVPAKNLLPTHMQRTPELIRQGAELVRRGGYIDFTAGCTDGELEETAGKLFDFLRSGAAASGHVTVSSDAYGSQPRFDSGGACTGLTYSSPRSLHRTVQALVSRGLPLEEALEPVTSTPALLLGQQGRKGCLAPGADADLLILDGGLEVEHVFARGRKAMWEKEVLLKGKFEA